MAQRRRVAPDLMLGSKVEAMLSAAGHDVTLSASLAEAPMPTRPTSSSPTSTPRTPRRWSRPGCRCSATTRTSRSRPGARPRRPGCLVDRPALADGPRAAGRSSSRLAQPRKPERRADVERPFEQAVLEVPGGPFAQHAPDRAGRARGRAAGARSCAAWSPRSSDGTAASRSSRAASGCAYGEPVAAGGRVDHRVDQVRVLVERLPRGGQDQLRVGRGAVVVDLEDRGSGRPRGAGRPPRRSRSRSPRRPCRRRARRRR